MPWVCPACQQQVQQRQPGLPRTDRVYRCPVCRLQMTFDLTANTMKPIPPTDDDDNDKHTRNVA